MATEGPRRTIIVTAKYIFEHADGRRTYHDTEVLRIALDEHADLAAAMEFARTTARELVRTTNGYDDLYVRRSFISAYDEWSFTVLCSEKFDNQNDIDATVTMPCM